MARNLFKGFATVLLAFVLGGTVAVAPASAVMPASTSVVVTDVGGGAGPTGPAVRTEWQAWGHYFGKGNCQDAGNELYAMRLIYDYRCVGVGLIIYRLDVKVTPI